MPGKRLGVRQPAAAIGVNHETYRTWEIDPHAKIADEHIKGLAKYYGTTPQYIRYGNEPTEPTLNIELVKRVYTMIQIVTAELGASVPPEKQPLVFHELYNLAASGQLDRDRAEAIIALAL